MSTRLFDLTGQAALVTGGAQGIGRGIALELARAGSCVVIADRNLRMAADTAAEVCAIGPRGIALELDVTDSSAIRRCIDAAMAHYGHIDTLVNNAGVHCEKISQPITVEHFHRCFEVNVLGVWRMTDALVPHFIAQKRGSIINIASINGRKPWADTPAYSASKAAVINLTQSLAIRLGADGITVNAVCPGGVMTAMAELFKEDRPALADEIMQSRLLKRPLLPEDIGRATVFFASPWARNITGQSLNVDGGSVLS